ncbi:MAG: signal peptidase I [Gammaproteobacteria bacterium]
MNFDLELVLVIGTLLTGGIWLLDRLWQARSAEASVSHDIVQEGAETAPPGARGAGQRDAHKDAWYVEYSKSFFPVLLIVLLLRGFVAEPFRIPSGSMMPTLLVGDFILVSKFAYDIRLPVTGTKLIETGGPQRGDVVVFRYPEHPTDDYIKRVVGLPGDHVGYYNKVLYINGKRAPQQPIGQYDAMGSGMAMNGATVAMEKLGDVKHRILLEPGQPGMEGEYIVPPDQYFVMGDNRDNSNDSRFWGFVPDENLVGKAFLIWLNWDMQGGVFDFTRIGDRID